MLTVPTLTVLVLAGSGRTQTWSEPFQHNTAHPRLNGAPAPGSNGNFTHPFSPWAASSTYLGGFPQPYYPPGTTIVDPPQVLPGYGWPQPQADGQTFNAVHMALIPKGPYRGMVIVWNRDERVLANRPPSVTLPGSYWSFQPYAIVDPTDNLPANGIRYRNFLLPIGEYPVAGTPPVLAGDIFCAGHTWSRFGDLIVVGGTDYWVDPVTGIQYLGGRMTFAWNPRLLADVWPEVGPPPLFQTYPFYPASHGLFGLWAKGPDLERPRWYPTATATHGITRETSSPGGSGARQRILVGGGIEEVPPAPATPSIDARNSYEALVVDAEVDVGASGLREDIDAGARTWFGPSNDPSQVEVAWLDEYPRFHQLSTGETFYSGYGPRWGVLDHERPGIWQQSPGQTGQPSGTYSSGWQHERHDGTSLLFPNFGGNPDIVVRLGGSEGFGGLTTDSFESIETAVSNDWVAGPAMPATDQLPHGGRTHMNVVLLPTGGLLVLGGVTVSSVSAPVFEPTLFEDGRWNKVVPNPIASRRTYHSTAVLLPDGRVFLGGGDDRRFDYEIFSPAYVGVPQNRPQSLVWAAPVPVPDPVYDADTLLYNQAYRIDCAPLPLGHAVEKVVLTAPCSTTHHSDMHQRYVELSTVVENGNEATFKTPLDEKHAPPGLYMLWLVTKAKSVSYAKWVLLP